VRTAEPIKIGLLVDYFESGAGATNIFVTIFQIVVDELTAEGKLDRGVEFIVEQARGLPEGSYHNVLQAFHRLCDQGCVAIYGPYVSDNAAPLRAIVEARAEVPIISVAGTESMLGDWCFALPAGSMEEEPIIMASVARHDGCKSIGFLYEDSMLGAEYLRAGMEACKKLGIAVTGSVPVPQVQASHRAELEQLAAGQPDGIMHFGFGLGLLGVNKELNEICWMPRRYTCTAFEFASNTDQWRQELAGWVGLDQYDERNETAQEFYEKYGDRFEGRKFSHLLGYDVGRMMLNAVATARPLTGLGVKEAYERIKMMPASTGAPGTRMRFGKFIRSGWVGSQFLVARRVLDDGSKVVMHGTIDGLVAHD
jgi:branched-chain amino acid transport system substrate-binding protein